MVRLVTGGDGRRGLSPRLLIAVAMLSRTLAFVPMARRSVGAGLGLHQGRVQSAVPVRPRMTRLFSATADIEAAIAAKVRRSRHRLEQTHGNKTSLMHKLRTHSHQ